jgi:hypothetical protein
MKAKRRDIIGEFEFAWLANNIKETNALALRILKKWGLDVGEMYDLQFTNGEWVPITPPLKEEMTDALAPQITP